MINKFNFVCFLMCTVSLMHNAFCRDSGNSIGNLKQLHEVTSIIANGILNTNCVIAIVESRLDSRMRFIHGNEWEQITPVSMALNLRLFATVKVLRGGQFPVKAIWIQYDPHSILQEGIPIHHIPAMNTEGVWLCFIKPVEKLPQTRPRDSSEISRLISEADLTSPPHELAKQLKFDSFLHRDNWYELAYEYSIFRISGVAIRDLPLPDNLSALAKEQFSDRIKKSRERRSKRQSSGVEYLLSEAQLKEIEHLIQLFENPDQPPSIEKLIALNSEFSRAIMRELAQNSSADLNEGLRKLKESIPQNVLEEMLKNQ